VTPIVTIYAVFANRPEAERIARQMVEARLAACVNILAPCRSVYRWQDAVEEADEVPALFKTRSNLVERLIATIAGAHSYDVPAIVRWDIAEAHPAYVEWIVAETA
jgi:periplasmic divalent cation tolerance protein